MRKKILIGTLSITLLTPGLSTANDFKETIIYSLESAAEKVESIITSTYSSAKEHASFKNVAIVGAAYYVGLPCLNRARHLTDQLLESGKKCGYGLGGLSHLTASLLALPARLQCWINPCEAKMKNEENILILSQLETLNKSTLHNHQNLATTQQLEELEKNIMALQEQVAKLSSTSEQTQ